MTWDVFCDGHPGWADSTIKSRIYSLEDIGSGEEVVDVVIDLSNDDLKALLIRKAMQLNVIFTRNDYLSLDGEIPYDLYTKVGIYGGFCTSDPYPDDQFDSFAEQIRLAENYVDSRVNQIHKSRKPKLTVGKAIGLGIAVGVVKGLFSTSKKHNGRCNGDCRNCPAHYGYRYGRWYYGHGHQHGCLFNGNGGKRGKKL